VYIIILYRSSGASQYKNSRHHFIFALVEKNLILKNCKKRIKVLNFEKKAEFYFDLCS